MFENCPLRYDRQRIKKEVIDTGGEASKYGERIHEHLETRMNGGNLDAEATQYEPLCKVIEELAVQGTLHVEHKLTLTENLTPTGWWDADAWLRSKLDILIVVGDNALVLDWKTGKRNADQFQLQLFAAQVFKHFPEVQQVDTAFVWLKSMELDSRHYVREDMPEVWAEIMNRIRRIYDAYEHDNWPARPSGLCRFCPCRNDCEYAK